jgi:CheY-like chemotaxis protein
MVLNILPGNWNFICLPGPVQRIIMNLAGNSLKYTQSGAIQVDMFTEDVQPIQDQNRSSSDQTTIVLRVSDTGNGISTDFLKNKLFTPFSQESTLAPGTGLGLNMVKSLVELQRGTIDIQSEVGKGTTVVVKIPLPRAQRKSNSPPLLRVISYGKDTQLPETKLKREKFEFHGFHSAPSKILRDSVDRYLVDWFDMSKVPENECAKIVIVYEEDLDDSLFTIEQSTTTPQLIIICHQTSQEQLFQRLSRSTIAGELLTMPFGPQKLAKVLSICLSALDKFQASSVSKETEDHETTSKQVHEILVDQSAGSAVLKPSQLENVALEQVVNLVEVSESSIVTPELPSVSVAGLFNGIKDDIQPLPLYSEAAISEAASNGAEIGTATKALTSGSTPAEAQPQLSPLLASDDITVETVSNIEAAVPEIKPAKTSLEIITTQNEEIQIRPKPQVPQPISILANGISSSPTESLTKITTLTQSSSPLRILCVDDNPINLRLLKTYMEKLRYTDVTCVENGALAFDAVKRRSEGFDLIFMGTRPSFVSMMLYV